METASDLPVTLTEQILAVREFNRFYTARLGLLRKRHLDGEFSLTEARILYEISTHPSTTASALCSTLELDAGYISRLLAALNKRRLIRQTPSKQDSREKQLTLTVFGEKAVARLNALSTKQLEEMLADISDSGRKTLAASLHKVRRILSRQTPAIRIERLTKAGEEAVAILEEYYEAVHVVQRDKPGSLKKLLTESGSGMWLAYRGDEVVGCVVLRRLLSIPHASECKRLYVKPGARGNHIADCLLDAQEEFACSQGIQWIYLDSYDDLKSAIALYERRGYRPCERYNDNPQATLFMRKKIV
ncbi:MAG TPA: helix-turn-helix domain-containing GNAT family N-acetyltransferase [Edaphobacter sp.]|jgi:DNA-binding MarR family transcriptional regulator/N-acetylglutamate synthase-like GNAT family acetyltransferase